MAEFGKIAVPAEASDGEVGSGVAARRSHVVRQYREAISAAPRVPHALLETLGLCSTCERRCPGLAECERERSAK